MNRGTYGNRRREKYERGEVVFSLTSPGVGFVPLDGRTLGTNINSAVPAYGMTRAHIPTVKKLIKDLTTVRQPLTWTTISSTFTDMERANNLNVAVSGGGTIQTSTDLSTWTARTSNFGTTYISSLAYGNSLWVAAGDSGQLRTSTDAITWTTRTSNFGTAFITEVAYGNGLWVAAGYNGQIRTSTDAITWVTQTSNFTIGQAIEGLAHGNSLWVAVGSSGQIRTSTDAITWTTRTSNFGSSAVTSIEFGNNLFVAGGEGGQMRSSTDGVTWVTRSRVQNDRMYDIAYGQGAWMAATGNFFSNFGQLWSSTDLVTWVSQLYNGGYYLSIAHSDGIWLAGGSQSAYVDNSRISLPNIPYGWVKL